jgi:hypothetical protein
MRVEEITAFLRENVEPFPPVAPYGDRYRASATNTVCPYYWYLGPAAQEEFNRNIQSLANWIEGAIQRFRSGVTNSRVIELHDTNHYVFIVDEALVVREMRKFLLEE